MCGRSLSARRRPRWGRPVGVVGTLLIGDEPSAFGANPREPDKAGKSRAASFLRKDGPPRKSNPRTCQPAQSSSRRFQPGWNRLGLHRPPLFFRRHRPRPHLPPPHRHPSLPKMHSQSPPALTRLLTGQRLRRQSGFVLGFSVDQG